MFKPLFVLLVLTQTVGISPSFCQNYQDLPGHFPRNPATIEGPSRTLFDFLVKREIPYEHRPSRPDRVEVWVDEDEFEEITHEGWVIDWAPESEKVYWEVPKGGGDAFVTPATSYPTYEQLTTFLQKKASDYPHLCLLQSIGQSVQGRELWFLKISDNPELEEDEPEFKYISSMHGNESLSVPLLMNLIDLLLENYGVEERYTSLIDETEIWIMPLMNPDGYARNPRSRTNANGFDLNRSFPDRVDDPENTTEGRQPEVQAVMNFGFEHSSVFSANFHTGALVMNYPYDSDFSVPEGRPTIPPQPGWFSPDDDVCHAVSLLYSMNNPPMFNSPRFENGVTNGISWYSLRGGMQDWNYVWLGCNEITIELSDSFQPVESSLLQYWEENRESMLTYMEQVHIGVRGWVTDARSGEPLEATVVVEGREHEVFTDPDVGDYHRMLLPGTYTLYYRAEGYRPKRVEGVIVEEGDATRVDVELERNATLITIR